MGQRSSLNDPRSRSHFWQHRHSPIAGYGQRDKPTSPASPWQNGVAERLIESIRRDCLDHIIVFGEAHLRRILRFSARYYNDIRTHRSLAKDAPVSRSVQRTGRIKSLPTLGGLHHHLCPGLSFSVHTGALRGRRRSRSWIIIERRAATAKKLPPVHPGEILREEFVRPLSLSPYAVARAIGVPRTRIERLANEQTPVTADTALRLGRYFGTSAAFWMGIQTQYDLERAEDELGATLRKIAPAREGKPAA